VVAVVAELKVDLQSNLKVIKVTNRRSQVLKTIHRASGTSTALSARMEVTCCAVKAAPKLLMSRV